MGVYVFECEGGWVKVGHHLVTPRRPNAYYRVAGRGFHSVVHPPALEGRLGVHELRLLAWFPNLQRSDELAVHRICDAQSRVGEFHTAEQLPLILAKCLELGGVRADISSPARKRALAWGARRAQRARRRRV